jgi:hypothetical protein
MGKRETMTIGAEDVGTMPAELLKSENGDVPGIIDPKTFSVPAVPNPYEEDFGVFTSGFFLPRLQLEGSSSKLVKTKKVEAGNYIVIKGKDDFEILGDQIDILVLTYRSKALDLSDLQNISASFEKDSDEFRRIVAASQHKSKGYLYGLEFLVWIPDYKGDVKFCTLHMGNPTLRVEAKNFKPLLGKAVTMKVKIIENAEYAWEAPIILPNNSGLSAYPSVAEMETQMKIFLDPPKGVVKEIVPDSAAEAAGVAGTEARDR